MIDKTPLNVTDEQLQKNDDLRVKTVMTTIGGKYSMVAHYVEQDDENIERMFAKYSSRGVPVYKAELGAIYGKDITRFWPLWVVYTVGILLTMLSMVVTKETTLDVLEAVRSTISPLSLVNLCYAMVAAQLLFGSELFDPRLCHALHALPVTRDLRYAGHTLAGLSFGIVPHLLIALVTTLVTGQWSLAGSLWLQAMMGQYVFFFGVAVISMFCTGNRVAATIVYGLLNFGSMALLWLADSILVPLMQGVALVGEDFSQFSPVVWMITVGKFYNIKTSTFYYNEDYIFVALEGWRYLQICSVVGAVALVAAVLLYRRRALECAGDFMAVKVLKPVFLVLYTLCIGAALAALGNLINVKLNLIFLLTGLVVGFFTGKMFLERTVRVFRWKSFLQLGVLAVALAAVLLAAQMDLFGISQYVPDPEAVERVEVVTYDNGNQELKTAESGLVRRLQSAHKLALEELGQEKDGVTYYITYHMNDGRVYKRQYTVSSDGKAAKKFQTLMETPEAILGMEEPLDVYVQDITDVQITGLTWPIEDNYVYNNYGYHFDLTQAVYEDLKYGYSTHRYELGRYTVSIWHSGKQIDMPVYKDSRTERFLENQEREALERYFSKIQEFRVIKDGNSRNVDLSDHYNAWLLKAILEDCWEREQTWDWEGDKENKVYIVRFKTFNPYYEKVFYISEDMHNAYQWINDYLFYE